MPLLIFSLTEVVLWLSGLLRKNVKYARVFAILVIIDEFSVNFLISGGLKGVAWQFYRSRYSHHMTGLLGNLMLAVFLSAWKIYAAISSLHSAGPLLCSSGRFCVLIWYQAEVKASSAL